MFVQRSVVVVVVVAAADTAADDDDEHVDRRTTALDGDRHCQSRSYLLCSLDRCLT